MYSYEFICAINEWQTGFSYTKQARIGKKIDEMVAQLPIQVVEKLQSSRVPLYRFEKFKKDRIWDNLILCNTPLNYSSWTTDLSIAQNFKTGAVNPKDGFVGVILRVIPDEYSVLLNLNSLYSDRNFISSIESYKNNIPNYDKGIGRYYNHQKEVILYPFLKKPVGPYNIYSVSSQPDDIKTLAFKILGRKPSCGEIVKFELFLRMEKKIISKPVWMSKEATKRSIRRTRKQEKELRKKFPNDFT